MRQPYFGRLRLPIHDVRSKFAGASVGYSILLAVLAETWIGFFATLSADAQLTVYENLGSLSGDTRIIGDTSSGGTDNATIYNDVTVSDGNWGSELVYQFSLPAPSYLEITSNSITGDPDFFLLDGLDVDVDRLSGKNAALGGIGSVFLDETPPATQAFGQLLDQGTYFLSVDSFIGFDGDVVPLDATFDILLSLSDRIRPPATAIDLGILGRVSTADMSVDTFGSEFDTVLALFDAGGTFLLENDDALDGVQSQLELGPLSAGIHYVALGGFGTSFDDGFIADSEDSAESGAYTLNYVGDLSGSVHGSLAAEEIVWFTFGIAPDTRRCDIDFDQLCDARDIDELMNEIAAGEHNTSFDLNGDGSVDHGDRDEWLSLAAQENGYAAPYLLGDTNLDGQVNSQDLNDLALHWSPPANSTNNWSDGNLTGAGVGSADLNALALNWRRSIPLATTTRAPVPEPSTLLLAAVALALVRIAIRSELNG